MTFWAKSENGDKYHIHRGSASTRLCGRPRYRWIEYTRSDNPPKSERCMACVGIVEGLAEMIA